MKMHKFNLHLAFLALLLFTAVPACAAKDAPKDFLRSIYAQYEAGLGKEESIPLANNAAIRHYFAPDLADIIIEDETAAVKRGEIPTLDIDPFTGSPDWEIARFDIKIINEKASQTEATVHFVNGGEEQNLRLFLLHGPEGWRVSDIDWGGKQGTLRALYKKPH
jgi:hypothetical protein